MLIIVLTKSLPTTITITTTITINTTPIHHKITAIQHFHNLHHHNQANRQTVQPLSSLLSPSPSPPPPPPSQPHPIVTGSFPSLPPSLSLLLSLSFSPSPTLCGPR
ncbi:hypothetical protein E2C01_077848 [Portunus trituberculatus]|uniref:Uncharacterized protein n=1 Tax=Portunus trituberculatus TaxID=210409 RepID=A0A5B7IH16_PORTR|nr:hypothetical protein [Portunus trituberculatus]